jgi:hypothetical protein
MDQDNPNNPGSTGGATNIGSGSSNYGAAGTGATPSAGGSTGSGTGSTGGGTADDLCPHCGQSTAARGGLEAFLGRLGITDDMIGNLKGQWDNVNIDEYLNTAREYLKDGSGKATRYAKENPGKVAAGVAVLALGAGLLYNAVREKSEVEVEFTPDYDASRNEPR